MFKKLLQHLLQRFGKIVREPDSDQPDEKRLDHLRIQWDLLSEKRIQLYKANIFEPRIDEKLRLQYLMKEIENEQQIIEQSMYTIEPSKAEALRHELEEKRRRLEQELKTLEHDYTQLKDQENTNSHLVKDLTVEELKAVISDTVKDSMQDRTKG